MDTQSLSMDSIRPQGAVATEHAWIRSSGWDVRWLIGSAMIVPVVLAFVWAGASSDVINIGTTALVGGPHLFATYCVTFMDGPFRRRHGRMLLAAALIVPSFVVFWTLRDFQILLSVFIFAASVHVLHQNAYLTDIYRLKSKIREDRWSRWVDYGLLMISIYPVAAYKLVHSNFMLGDVEILIPDFLMTPWTYRITWAAFAFFLVAWCAKTLVEVREGRLNKPKTLLIVTTCAIAFVVPMAASGERLELAFQAVNAWHSIQYLGMIWLIQHRRKQRGLIESKWLASLSGEGRPALKFYAFVFGITAVLFVFLISMIRIDPLGLSYQQYYYMGVLSCLLVHYVIDGYAFMAGTRQDTQLEDMPYAAPVLA